MDDEVESSMKYARLAALGALVLPVIAIACGGGSGDDLFGNATPAPSGGGGSGGKDASPDGNGGASQGGTGGSQAKGGSGGVQTNGGSGGTQAKGGSGGTVMDGGSGGAPKGGSGGSTAGGAGGSAGTGGAACPLVHDEDGDTIDDDCDNCPSYANTDQANGDGDGVGDACERPNDPGFLSTLLYFNPFVQPAVGWEFGGMYKDGADEILGSADNCGATCQDNAYFNTPLDGQYSAETTFTYEYASFGYAGILFGEKQVNGNRTWWGCLLNRPGELQTRYLGIWNLKAGAQQIDKMAEIPNPEDKLRDNKVQRKIRVYVSGGGVTCTFDTDAGDHAQLEASAAPGSFDGRTGMRVYSAYAHFRNFVMYKP
jgi:hypothetical protein